MLPSVIYVVKQKCRIQFSSVPFPQSGLRSPILIHQPDAESYLQSRSVPLAANSAALRTKSRAFPNRLIWRRFIIFACMTIVHSYLPLTRVKEGPRRIRKVPPKFTGFWAQAILIEPTAAFSGVGHLDSVRFNLQHNGLSLGCWPRLLLSPSVWKRVRFQCR